MALRFYQLLSLLTLAAGKPISFSREVPDVPQAGNNGERLVDVKLFALGNSTVRASVTNVGDEAMRLVKAGSILDDDHPTMKVAVSGKHEPTFSGAQVAYINSHLTPDAFIYLAPNQTTESVFNVADSHDLSPGEQYSAVADGSLEYTLPSNPKKFSLAPYHSNKISFEAPETVAKDMTKRSSMEGCDGKYSELMKKNLKRVDEMAKAAAKDARDGKSGNFKKFFKTDDKKTRTTVADRMDAVAKEATSTGVLKYYCQASAQDSCGGGIAAITYPTEDRVVNCQGYYESTEVSNNCGYLDQASISLHEYTHATSVYGPGTEDVAYGYDSVLQLSTDQALRNADSFAYYASAVFLKCDGKDAGAPGAGSNSGSGAPGGGSDSGSGAPGGGSDSGSGAPGGGSDSGSGAPGGGSDSGPGSGPSGPGNSGPGGPSGSGDDGYMPWGQETGGFQPGPESGNNGGDFDGNMIGPFTNDQFGGQPQEFGQYGEQEQGQGQGQTMPPMGGGSGDGWYTVPESSQGPQGGPFGQEQGPPQGGGQSGPEQDQGPTKMSGGWLPEGAEIVQSKEIPVHQG